MKTLVAYYSKYGSTEKYAKWISDELKSDVIRLDELDPEILKNYDLIILGSGVYAGSLKLKKVIIKNKDVLSDKKVILFAVGATPASEELKSEIFDNILKKDQCDNYKTFILRGAFNFEKLTLEDKLLMNMYLQKIKLDKNLDEKSKAIIECKRCPSDWTDIIEINEIISFVKGWIK